MVDEDNLEEELTLPGKRTAPVATPESSISPSTSARLAAEDHILLERSLNSAQEVHAKMETYSKRLAGGAAAIIFLSGILLMVAGGRLSGQVDALQSATLSITKRIVNMNSALERMVVLEQKLALLDEGQAQLLESLSDLDEGGALLSATLEKSMLGMQSTVDNATQASQSGAESALAIAAKIDDQQAQLGELSKRISRVESGMRGVTQLRSDVSTLVQIERENLTELFEAQLALEQARLTADAPELLEEPEPKFPEGTIVFPPESR